LRVLKTPVSDDTEIYKEIFEKFKQNYQDS
jgi:hypothetical protein